MKKVNKNYITIILLIILNINAPSHANETTEVTDNNHQSNITLTETVEPIATLSSLILQEYIKQIESQENLTLTPLDNTEIELKRKNYNNTNSEDIALFAKDYDSCKTRYKKLLEMHREKESNAKALAYTGGVLVPTFLAINSATDAVAIRKIDHKIDKINNERYYYFEGRYYNPPKEKMQIEKKQLTLRKGKLKKFNTRFGGTLLLLELTYLYYINEQGVDITDELRTMMIDMISVVGVTVAACGSIKCEFENNPERILQHRTKLGKGFGLDETVACEYIGASETISKTLHDIDIELSRQEHYTEARVAKKLSEKLDSLRADK